jgi:hypothetical protein
MQKRSLEVMHKSLAHLLIITAMAAAPALATETRSAGKHEHGVATLDIAIDGNDMAIDLDGPADNFIGFEHKPSTPEQSAALAAALDSLRAGNALFLTPTAAGCQMISSAASPPDYDDSGHADIEASWEFRCSSPTALLWVDVQLFARFPGTQKLSTSVVTPAGQKAVILKPGTVRVLMPREATPR